jgi:hypothetical protein
VVAHLFGRHPLGVQDDGQAFIAPVAGAVGAGDVQGVADPPLDRQPGGIQRRADVQGDLHVAELDRRVDLVNGDVRLIAERRIEFHKLGRYVRISEPALAAFIEAGRVPPMEASVIWRQNRQVA